MVLKDLKSLSDLELINNIKKFSCNDSFIEIVTRHENLFYKICHCYAKVLESFNYSRNELFEEKDSIIFEAIIKFNPNKGAKFSTWLGNWTRFFCLNKINKLKNMLTINSENDIKTVFESKSIEKFEISKRNQVNFNNVKQILTKAPDSRVVGVFKLRYNPKLRKKTSWAKIASRLNVSLGTAIKLHKVGIEMLRKEIEEDKLETFYCS